MKNLSIDIETFSSEKLTKCGVYRYAEAPDFEVLPEKHFPPMSALR